MSTPARAVEPNKDAQHLDVDLISGPLASLDMRNAGVSDTAEDRFFVVTADGEVRETTDRYDVPSW